MTKNESANLSEDAKLVLLKEAKAGECQEGWAPFCLKCSYQGRMPRQNYGFKCLACGNKIGWDLKPFDARLPTLKDAVKEKTERVAWYATQLADVSNQLAYASEENRQLYERNKVVEAQLTVANKDAERARYLLERVVGVHNAPEDCYSTGPQYGDARDSNCPSCEAIKFLSSHAQRLEEGKK